MKIRYDRLLIVILGLGLIIFLISLPFRKEKMIDLSSYSIDEVKEYASKYELELEIKEEYNDSSKGSFISQSIKKGEAINKKDKLIIVYSLGKEINYKDYNVNELGRVPIMMYHGIQNMKNSETKYTGGNIDKDGYQRTSEAFRKDLEFYYESGYRMIKLNDYVNGNIDVELGYSPLILTFDDGLSNNILVTDIKDGEIVIDPNSAVGILEEFKKKYPDFNVTATFFVNGNLFNQKEYNNKILNWLVNNGYDIGNHTYNHVNFNSATSEKAISEVARIYQKLDSIIPGKYVNIMALPYGYPSKSHSNFKHILEGSYEGYSYNTIATLRVGWESDLSPFNTNFDKTYLKRIRAYDNNGTSFDIESSFKSLEKTRYISDGNKDTVTIKKEDKDLVKTNKKVNLY